VSEKPLKIFYGWWIVTACFICAMFTGVVGYGFTAFFNPFVQEFGWSYAAVSLGASLRGAETGLLSPILGFLVDRWSSKWLLFAGALFVGLGLIFLSMVTSLAQYYAAWFLIALGTSCCGPVVVNPAINHWFRRNLGKATGILAAGFAMSGVLVPVIYKLIEWFGWREALIIIGITCIVICVPLTFIVKHKPEQYGYLPDGDTVVSNPNLTEIKKTESKNRPSEVDISVRQALKSRTFWFLTAAFTLQSVVIISVISHIMPYLKTVDINGATASFFAGSIPVLSILGRLGAGWLSDKFDRKKVTAIWFIVFCIGTLLFDYVTDSTLLLLVTAVILFSVSYGSTLTLRAVLMREYFGKTRFASIFGILVGIQSLGAMLGPFLAGWTFDVWKSYHYAWLLFLVVNIAAVVFVLATPKINHKNNPVT
jgi:sugar phosphate permease